MNNLSTLPVNTPQGEPPVLPKYQQSKSPRGMARIFQLWYRIASPPEPDDTASLEGGNCFVVDEQVVNYHPPLHRGFDFLPGCVCRIQLFTYCYPDHQPIYANASSCAQPLKKGQYSRNYSCAKYYRKSHHEYFNHSRRREYQCSAYFRSPGAPFDVCCLISSTVVGLCGRSRKLPFYAICIEIYA